MKTEKIIIPVFFFILIFFTIYSYSQVDLNLTLSSNGLYQLFQKQMTFLGFYNRQLSSFFYVFFIFAFFLIYRFLVKDASKIFSIKKLIRCVGLMILISFFAYPAMYSYDIFNYIFDARIITKYHLNPYEHTALNFPDDLWTRFMRWTHRTYPYGPVWLVLTVPLVYLGMGKLVPTLILFKLFFSLCFSLNILLIYRIMKRVDGKNAVPASVFFAFNPLVFTESLLSPHLDSVMLTFLLLGIYSLVVKKRFVSFLAILFSGGVKFVTWAIIPIIFLKADHKKLFQIAFILGLLATSVMIYIRQLYPWYFIPLVGIASLSVSNSLIRRFTMGVTFIVSFQYLTYIFSGGYNKSLDMINYMLFYIPVGILVLFGVLFIKTKKFSYVDKK